MIYICKREAIEEMFFSVCMQDPRQLQRGVDVIECDDTLYGDFTDLWCFDVEG